MKFQFEVGTNEKHLVTYHFNEFWASITVKVDGVRVWSNRKTTFREILSLIFDNALIQGRATANLSSKLGRKSDTSGFTVGKSEAHQIYICREVDRTGGFFAKTKYDVFIDFSKVHHFEHVPGVGEKTWKLSFFFALCLVGMYFVVRKDL